MSTLSVQVTQAPRDKYMYVTPPQVRTLTVLDTCTCMHFTIMWACSPDSWIGKFVLFRAGYPDRDMYVCKNAHRDQRIATWDDAVSYIKACGYDDDDTSTGTVVALIVFLLREYQARKSFDHVPDTVNVESTRIGLLETHK